MDYTNLCPVCGSALQDGVCLSCLAEQSTCVLCFSKFDKNDNIIRCKECNYLAHRDPMKKWLKSNGQCPVCRIEYNREGFVEFSLKTEALQQLVEIRQTKYIQRQEIFNRFSFKLPYYHFQHNLLTEIVNDLQSHSKYLLISPPGSGKTIIGLSLAQELGVHTLVLTPNLAVLGSWLDMSVMFLESKEENLVAEVVGQEAGELHPITVLTYQKLNYELNLLNKEQATIEQTTKINKKGDKGKSAEKQTTKNKPAEFEKNTIVRSNPTSLIHRLQAYDIGLIITDEAHRLTGAWGDDVAQLQQLFPDAKILGLTATPPFREQGVFASVFTETVRRIPLPPLVRAKITAPYRDLVYFIPVPEHKHLLTIRNKYSSDAQILLGKITEKSIYTTNYKQLQITYEDFLYYKGYAELYGKKYSEKNILHSKWMLAHLLTIMKKEMDVLHEKFRGVILFDYEKGHANISKKAGMGGAIGCFEALVTDTKTDTLDPIFVTGKSILVDDDATERFLADAEVWKKKHNKQFTLKTKSPKHTKYTIINGSGPDWNTETYTRYITHLFEKGITKLLVGTRFLLGEGWDSRKLNVLFDLTLTSGYASVNQIKGRAFRRDPDDPAKVSHIWEFVNSPQYGDAGMKSYQNFSIRHKNYFGLDDKQNIRSGIKKFHNTLIPFFKTTSYSKIRRIEKQLHKIDFNAVNKAMLKRITKRNQSLQLWKVGEKIGTLTTTYTIPLSKHITSLDRRNYAAFETAFAFVFRSFNPEKFIRIQREDNSIAVHFSSISNEEQAIQLYQMFNDVNFQYAYEIRMDVIPFPRLPVRRWLYANSVRTTGILKKLFTILTTIIPPKSHTKIAYIIPMHQSIASTFLTDTTNAFNTPSLFNKDPLIQLFAIKKEWLSSAYSLIHEHIGLINLETRFID